MTSINLYKLAQSSIVDYTDNDVTACVMKEYALKSMYSILSCLNSMNMLRDKSRLIALPDFTFSRNDNRFRAGFPYGSIIYLDTGSIPFILPEFRPNCCGIAMVKLYDVETDVATISTKIQNINQINATFSGDDLRRGNHFIGIYHDVKNDSHYAIIHGSFSFVKSGLNNVPGLYLDKTQYWNNRLRYYNIANSRLPYLLGDDAVEYYDSYVEHEKNTKRLRAQAAEFLFENCNLVFNETHEGFFNINTIVLGAYISNSPFKAPIMLSAESGLPIVEVLNPLSDLPMNLYVCPHGGGYALRHIANGSYNEEENTYRFKYISGTVMIANDLRQLIFDYRQNTDFIWAEKYGFGKIECRLSTKYNFKL